MHIFDTIAVFNQVYSILCLIHFSSARHSIRASALSQVKADRMQRAISRKMYDLENELEPMTIIFYEKILMALSAIANEAENTGDLLREMIIKG